jgi:hypothetical protein
MVVMGVGRVVSAAYWAFDGERLEYYFPFIKKNRTIFFKLKISR